MMTEAIIVALITGGFTFIGVLISNSKKDGAIEERLNELTKKTQNFLDFFIYIYIITFFF